MKKTSGFSVVLACLLALGLVFVSCQEPVSGTTTYTVTFNLNGGSGTAPSAQTVSSGSDITLPDGNGLTKIGYAFGGWNTEPDGTGTNYSAKESFTPSGNVVLYAKWNTLESVMGLANKLAWLQANAQSNNSYILEVDADESITGTYLNFSTNDYDGIGYLKYDNKSNITITLRGTGANRTISPSLYSMFVVGSGVTLVLDNNITLQGRGNYDSLVRVNPSGTLVMNGGKISGNTDSSNGYDDRSSYSYGGGVYVAEGGTFTMNNGEISGNTASSLCESYGSSYYVSHSYGGGVYIAGGGIFIMKSGKISGNTASSYYTYNISNSSRRSSSYNYSYGGGVYVAEGGTFIMENGEISGNTAVSGGGVYVGANGTFTMSGGEISGNTSTNTYASAAYGGGIYMAEGGTFIMESGEISGNTGSGVYMADGGTFTMNNGEISGNSGGSVFYSYSDYDGSINGYSSYGGGVYMAEGGTFTMNNGEISGNTVVSVSASSYASGGGVYCGTFTMNGGKISGNTASASGSGSNYSHSSVSGGGVYCGTFTMSGGEISGNTASASATYRTQSNGYTITGYLGYGGGVYSPGTFNKTGGTIYGYSEGDSVNSNVVKSSSGVVRSNSGHAVYGGTVNDVARRRETTAGPEVNLYLDGSSFSEGWEN